MLKFAMADKLNCLNFSPGSYALFNKLLVLKEQGIVPAIGAVMPPGQALQPNSLERLMHNLGIVQLSIGSVSEPVSTVPSTLASQYGSEGAF